MQRSQRFRRVFAVAALVAVAAIAAACSGDDEKSSGPAVLTAAGTTADDVRAAVDAFKLIFGADNGGEPGALPGGFRTITWDAVPDEQAAPAYLPGDFFNDATAPRARGAILETDGAGVQVSSKLTDARFGNIDPSYTATFATFSGDRLVAPVGDYFVDITFRLPGSDTPAVVRGFGGVYTDVDTDYIGFEFFDAAGRSLGGHAIPISDGGFSFLGVAFDEPVVARVRIQFGIAALGQPDGPSNDVAVMDDFIYGEPQPIKG